MKTEDNKENLIDTNFQQIDVSKEKEADSPSRFLNKKKIHSSDIDFDRTKELNNQNDNLSTVIKPIKIEKENFETVQSVGLIQIYRHLITRNDAILTVFAILGSIGDGLTFPLMIYTTSDVYSKMENTTEMTMEEIQKILKIF